MNDIEAIHAIEVILAEEEICGCFDFAPIELAALSHAIAAMKRMEEIGNVYAKAAAIDREFRLLHVRIDSLCCDLNPNKELPEESK